MSFDTLFKKWKTSYNFKAFIRDGIVDSEHYSKPHILFVLRDMNCKVERDLCADLCKNGSGWKTWNNIGRWTIALLDGDNEYPKDMSTEKRVAQLKRIAVMNLKKEGGESRAVGSELLDAVREQNKMIYEEICLCDPSIIICCGLSIKGGLSNADLLWHHVFPLRSEWEKYHSTQFSHDWWYYYANVNEKKIPVISFCHPQTTNFCGCRGHEKLFIPLYREMLCIRDRFLKTNMADE